MIFHLLREMYPILIQSHMYIVLQHPYLPVQKLMLTEELSQFPDHPLADVCSIMGTGAVDGRPNLSTWSLCATEEL